MAGQGDVGQGYVNEIVDLANSGNTSGFTKSDWQIIANNAGYETPRAAAARVAAQQTPPAVEDKTEDKTEEKKEQFDYNAWRKGEDQRLAGIAESRRINQALSSMEGFFQTNGLMSLWGGVRSYVEQGYSDADTIMAILSRDANYQQAYHNRFPAVKEIRALNAQRAAQGLPPRAEPSPAAYIALEAGYRQALVGLPDGVWGRSEDIADWIVGEVSVQEVADRVSTAKNYIYYDANDLVKEELRGIYGMTNEEMVSYVLDPDRALPQLEAEYERRKSQANVGAGARSQGVGLSELLRDEISQTQFGSTFDMSSQTFKSVANESVAYERLGKLAREETTQADLIREAFGISGSAEASIKKKRLASQERAKFSGQSALSKTSLAQRRAQ